MVPLYDHRVAFGEDGTLLGLVEVSSLDGALVVLLLCQIAAVFFQVSGLVLVLYFMEVQTDLVVALRGRGFLVFLILRVLV